MFDRERIIDRTEVGTAGPKVMELPDLVDIQLSSYERFLQRERLLAGEPPLGQGLLEVFESTFPIESPSGDLRLEFDHYILDEENIKMSEVECKNKGNTYAVPIKARINLIFLETGEIRQKDIYMGDIPLMTERGTFIINGAERVVVSQIHRSPGVIFSHEKGVYSSRIIPYRGSWLEFEIDQKRDLIYAKIDRKKRILGTLFLRALSYDTREKIIDLFYRSEEVKIKDNRELRDRLVGRVLARAVFSTDDEGQERKIYRAGEKIHPHDVDELLHGKVKSVWLIDDDDPDSLHADIILNCFEREESKFVGEDADRDEPSKEDAISAIYAVLQPGEPITMESAEKDFQSMFFSSRRYDLGRVGRYKLNK
ncbi:MAG: DNA-directed RNA polymerase subunit beta, partial [Spirochaetales bacterium]|nr:DNA-directed RNA polymerase subunit beta [Spirochaetales bacterium]